MIDPFVYRLEAPVAAAIRRVAAVHGAPFYVYEAGRVRRAASQFHALPWDPKSVHFAMMANESAAFLRIVRSAGLGVFVNSVVHLGKALREGFSGRKIVFTASAMDPEAMRAVREAGAVLNLDSLGQIEAWRRLFPSGGAGIRCNLGDAIAPRSTRAGYFQGNRSRLGLTLPEIEALSGSPWVEGLHLYVGTDLLDLDPFRDGYQRLAGLAGRFPALRYLDLGGGFGVSRPGGPAFDFAGYGRLVDQVMQVASDAVGRRLELILEPGRIIGAEAGFFVCRVTDVKTRGGRQLAGVNASVAQFPRPLLYDDATHPVALLPGDERRIEGGSCESDIFGCSTYSRDYLALGQQLPPVRVGDLVVFAQAGAYCASSHTSFLGFERADEVYM